MSSSPATPRSLARLDRAAILVVLAVLVAVLTPSGAAIAHQGEGEAAQLYQSGRMTLLPPISQVGSAPAARHRARTVISANFFPTRPGRPVVLMRKTKKEWVRVARARLDDRGRVEFAARTRVAGGPVTYRVSALRHRGLDAVHTNPERSTMWGPADFADDFDGAALSPAWSHRIQFHNPWGGRKCSKGSPDAVGVGHGALRLSVLADPTLTSPCAPTSADGQPLGAFRYRLNGHISTQNAADFKYGVAAARIKMHRDLGQHAAFWLQPRGLLPVGTTPWGAEIDVIEYVGGADRERGLFTTIYEPTPTGDKTRIGTAIVDADSYLANRADSWWDQYHVFSVQWTPTEYVFRIDGRETWRTTQGVSHHEQFLILSLLSSDYELPAHGNEADIDEHAYVDWVQFWRTG